MPRSSLAELLLDHYARHAGEVAFVQPRGYRREALTYRQVLALSSAFAQVLDRRQIAKGDHVLLWGESRAEWVAAFLGCMLRGVVVIPMDKVSTPAFVARIAQQTSAKLLVHAHELVAPGSVPAVSFGELTGLPAGDLRPVPLSRNDTLQIIFTSGATADPRGVVTTHGNVLANLEPFEREIPRYLKYERLVHPIRFLGLVPLSHVFGQFMSIFIPPLLGGTVVFTPALTPGEIIPTIKRERVSVLIAVPRILESLQHSLETEHADLLARFQRGEGKHFTRRWWIFRDIHRRFGWKFWAIVSGGATLDPAHESFWERLGIAVLQGYGLTESTSLISVNHPFERGRGTIGKVLPGRGFTLSDSGEILVRGENIATSYWQAGELRPVAGEDGWFRTGDLGELDAEGYLHFKGRQKNVIVTPEGMKVFPADLEAALNAQPGIKEAVVFGIDRSGNAEACAVLLVSGSAADIDAAVRNANSKLAGYQRILHYIVWPEADFPRTPTHKPRLAALRSYATEVLSDNGLPRPSPSAGRDHSEIAELVRKVSGRQTTQAVIPREGIEAPADQTLNLSSLERVELMCALEERYQVDLNERDFAEVETLRDLEQLIATATRSTLPRQPVIPSESAAVNPAQTPSQINMQVEAPDFSRVNTDELSRGFSPGQAPDKTPQTGTTTVAQTFRSANKDTLIQDRALAAARTTFTYPRWAQRFPIPLIRTIAYHLITLPLTYLFSWPKIVGREHLRGLRGPVLVVANHITYVDQGFILAALPFRLRKLAIAMEGERLEAMRSQPQTFTTAPTFRATQAVSPDSMKGRLARAWESRRKLTLPLAYYLATALFNVFPLPKLSGFRKSFAFAGELADKGYSVLVFPEGLRTVNGEISEFRSGMGLLAEGLRIPVVPMRIRGLWEVNQRGWRIVAPWRAISVHIGEPVSYPDTTTPEAIARDLESRVRAL